MGVLSSLRLDHGWLVVPVVGVAEGAERVFDCAWTEVDFHVDVLGFHSGGVEFEDFEFGGDAVGGCEGEDVGFEVGEGKGDAVAVDQGDGVDDFDDVAVFVVDES